ncbi:MAG: HD domain-containing protein [Nitrospirae bacterium]|nr:HD domain-containing protein [Nitrospirota bacterium]
MDPVDLLNLQQQFLHYCRSFASDNKEEAKNYTLKELHSLNVSATMLSIAQSELQNRNMVLIAETIGLLHDIGRFPQYAQYRTFRDSDSVNHGRLGAEVLTERKMLAALSRDEQELVLDAVRFHNAYAIPQGLDPEKKFFLRMIRDADKLDIWRVFAEYYEKAPSERETAAGLGLPDRPEYSDNVLACLAGKRLSRISDLKTLNDFGIMQLTWIYDLNFPVSFRLASERGHIDRIISILPATEEIIRAVSTLRQHISNRASQ